jgi:hypothetical protein
MNNLKVLKFRETCRNDKTGMYIVDADKVETLNLADTYDAYGQEVGHVGACDYCVQNGRYGFNSNMLSHLRSEGFGETIDSLEENDDLSESEIAELLCSYEDDFNETETKISQKIKDAAEKFADENQIITTCEGWNYWDGHNYQSVVVACEQDDAVTANIIDDDEAANILAEYEDVEWGEWEGAERKGVTENYTFTEARYAGAIGILVEYN